MKQRIFVTGFQRGGTTLMRRLIHNHPDVECMIHERRILNRIQDLKNASKAALRYNKWEGDVNGIWGEKVPWNTPLGLEVIQYMDKWEKAFGDSARFITIIRNPMDVGASNAKLGWTKASTVASIWEGSMRNVIKNVKAKHGLCVVYENLLQNPKAVLREVFKYCDLDYSEQALEYVTNLKKKELRYFNRIEPSRAFVHTTEQDKQKYMKFVKEFWV